jgi:OOP family OmpA-OmpF porin
MSQSRCERNGNTLKGISLMKNRNKHVWSVLAIVALLPTATLAQSYPNQGYWVDESGAIVTSSVSGLCWHTGEWTPELAVESCDPVLKRVAVAVPQQAPAPAAPVAVAQAAPPVPLEMPSQKVSFSDDALFGFDKSEIKPAGKIMLDGLVDQLKSAQFDTVQLTGHTDRLGSAAYNQSLSERRANAVKNYLVSKNVPSERVKATGLGETQPVTKPTDCVGKTSPKLIACLQPDRRVDVEMSGTKAGVKVSHN